MLHSSISIGIGYQYGIARGQYYWMLDIGALFGIVLSLLKCRVCTTGTSRLIVPPIRLSTVTNGPSLPSPVVGPQVSTNLLADVTSRVLSHCLHSAID